MAQTNNYIPLYMGQIELIKTLPVAYRWEVLRAVCEYYLHGAEPQRLNKAQTKVYEQAITYYDKKR